MAGAGVGEAARPGDDEEEEGTLPASQARPDLARSLAAAVLARSSLIAFWSCEARQERKMSDPNFVRSPKSHAVRSTHRRSPLALRSLLVANARLLLVNAPLERRRALVLLLGLRAFVPCAVLIRSLRVPENIARKSRARAHVCGRRDIVASTARLTSTSLRVSSFLSFMRAMSSSSSSRVFLTCNDQIRKQVLSARLGPLGSQDLVAPMRYWATKCIG